MTEKHEHAAPTSEKAPAVSAAAVKALEEKKKDAPAQESHGEEKKAGPLKIGAWAIFGILTSAAFLAKNAYKGFTWLAKRLESGDFKLPGGDAHGGGDHGGHGGDAHGGDHGGGHH
jgi:hypothetical protein